ncbi:DUF4007 family protein [Stenotrophomonas maltophilia]|uniref:DUF4007 family protein n=1 Tax=Stenotrophomonas maltophilia TaxID=40324 RepID=UPI001F3D8094|nr:DUF4007 family protein [Stenotrophomonas maltophilia]MCF3528042.1 DUF4007 family protein [Stenotrophomonas maltophilia]MCF3531926.1 DUF4007 family protein [Stenotrophomonas maltophilia]
MSSLTLPDQPQFSGHETFPLRQLWLRKAYDAAIEELGKPAKDVFAAEKCIRRFGVGKNMVSAIRHWALACDVITEFKDGSVGIGVTGKALFGHEGLDPYLERPATAWWVHWLLAGRAKRSTSWWWIFNQAAQQSFDVEQLTESLEAAAKQAGLKTSRVTLKRDVEVCIRCYVSRRDSRGGDDAAEPLLVELGLISEGAGGSLGFQRGSQASLPDGLFAMALLEFWGEREVRLGSQQATLSFEAISHEYGSPGRVFKLDERGIGERLANLEELTGGQLRWTDTAGVRQVSRQIRVSQEEFFQSLFRSAYGK